MPRLAALATAVPPHVIEQADARRLAERLFADASRVDGRLLGVFENAAIEKRHACVPLEWFASNHDFAEKNALYVEHATGLGLEAAARLLARAELPPSEVDHLVFVSSTGVATPSVDARIANRLGMRADVRRTPIWGLGCAGGAAGLARARDFALADPGARVLLVAVELCALTFQHGDHSRRNLVASALFGEGAAAALVVGADAPPVHRNGGRPLELRASSSVLWKDTLDVMGWTVDGAGLHVVFARDIPTLVRERVGPSLDAFLEGHELRRASLDHLIAHPGGVKVLRAYVEALGLEPSAVRHAREVLRDYGNMSSPTCLFVLERFLEAGDIGAGDTAVLTALGPGFSAEYVLLAGDP